MADIFSPRVRSLSRTSSGSVLEIAASRHRATSATVLALGMISVVAVRLPELSGIVASARPVIIATLIALWWLAFKTTYQQRKEVFSSLSTKLVCAYLLFVLASVPFAVYSAGTFAILKALLAPVLMFLTIQFVRPHIHNLERLQRSLVIASAVYATYALIAGDNSSGRLKAGGMYDPNDMASLMAIALVLGLGLIAHSASLLSRLAVIYSIVVLGLAAVATGSRGGLVGLIAGVIVFMLGLKGTKRLAVLLGSIPIAVVVWSAAPEGAKVRLSSLMSLENDYNQTSDSGRRAIWERGLVHFAENPLVGVGPGNFSVAEGLHFEARGKAGKWLTAHNTYIQVLAEQGLVGAGVFFTLLIISARSAFNLWREKVQLKHHPHRPEYMAAMAVYLTTAVFLSQAYFPALFALLGLVALASRTLNETAQLRPDPTPRSVQHARWARALGRPVRVLDSRVRGKA